VIGVRGAGRRAGRATALLRLSMSLMVAAAATSCGEVARTGRGPGILVIDSLTASSGASPGQFVGVLASDVLTFVTANVNGQEVRVPTIFEDPGSVSMRVVLKDQGTPGFPAQPSPLQDITVTRYRVVFKRADGRNTPGVDVPYPFDGAVTFTVGPSQVSSGFILVRAQAKLEAPLRALVGAGGANAISTIAEVTFYGRDQAGNEVSATGMISVNFSDWGDPS
jgi:hypothetical protein